MPRRIGDGQEGQEVAGESNGGIDDAPDSSKMLQQRINFRTATFQWLPFFWQAVGAQVVHLLHEAGCRLIGQQDVIRCHLLCTEMKAEHQQRDGCTKYLLALA